jgi:hypothetical protein
VVVVFACPTTNLKMTNLKMNLKITSMKTTNVPNATLSLALPALWNVGQSIRITLQVLESVVLPHRLLFAKPRLLG